MDGLNENAFEIIIEDEKNIHSLHSFSLLFSLDVIEDFDKTFSRSSD
jgi:hypothetical protein